MENPLIKLFNEQVAAHQLRIPFHTVEYDVFGDPVAILEMYRRQTLPIVHYNEYDGEPRYAFHDQVTIAVVELEPDLQGRGFFREFLQHIEQTLPGLGAIQLQCVTNEWLQAKLDADPTWLRQSRRGENMFNPSFVKVLDQTIGGHICAEMQGRMGLRPV